MANINPAIFKSYDVRGVYPEDLDEEGAYLIGAAFAKYLHLDLNFTSPITVAVGQDMRGSSPFLARQLISGLNDQGINVVDLGRVPTPALYYATAFKNYSAGVMVTASHNPKQYNGFKFCRAQAVPIGLTSGLERIKEYTFSPNEKAGGESVSRGSFYSVDGVTKEYVNHDLSYLDINQIQKMKIVADPANAMGSVYLDELFGQIPCEPIRINWDLNGNMPSHEANPLNLDTLQQIREVIKNERADFGIATDGDGDRLGFLDEQGELIPADFILGLMAKLLLKRYPGEKIGYDLRSSRVVKEVIEESGGIPVETMVGHSNIKAIMREQNILFSGELSMHYYFRENHNFESPVFVAASLLFIRSMLGKPFSEIWRSFQKYFHSGEINFEVKDKSNTLEHLEKRYGDGQISRLDGIKVVYPNWWFSVRASNTEPLLRLNLEADTRALMTEKLQELKQVIAGK